MFKKSLYNNNKVLDNYIPSEKVGKWLIKNKGTYPPPSSALRNILGNLSFIPLIKGAKIDEGSIEYPNGVGKLLIIMVQQLSGYVSWIWNQGIVEKCGIVMVIITVHVCMLQKNIARSHDCELFIKVFVGMRKNSVAYRSGKHLVDNVKIRKFKKYIHK